MASTKSKLAAVAKDFPNLSIFGGPAADIAMMGRASGEKELIAILRPFPWSIGATKVIPGANSTEMALHCGHERAGWRRYRLPGARLIIPGLAITALIAGAGQQYRHDVPLYSFTWNKRDLHYFVPGLSRCLSTDEAKNFILPPTFALSVL